MNKSLLKNIIALTIGRTLEWYDFYIYSFVSIYLVNLFFPSMNPVNSILAVTATFGVTFLARPLGGVILGYYSDKYGRLKTMNLIILIMTIAMLIIAFAPTYHQIGIYAPLLILFARCLQGFSTGAEFGVSASILMELAPSQQRGLYSSLQTFGQMIAVLLSSLVGMQLANNLSNQQMESWGWRVPFILGLFIIPVGIYLRRQFNEADIVIEHKLDHSLLAIIRNNIKPIIITAGHASGGAVFMFVSLTYMPIYATRYLHLTSYDTYVSILIGVGLMTMLIPIFGWLSDHVGRKRLIVCSMLLYFIEIVPCYLWLNMEPSMMKLIVVQSVFGCTLAIYYGAITAAMSELFSENVRSTCLSIGLNTGVLTFGAFAQFIVTLLINYFATPVAIIIYPLFCVAVCLISAIFYRQNTGQNTAWVKVLSVSDNINVYDFKYGQNG